MDNEKSHGKANAKSNGKQNSSTGNENQILEQKPIEGTPFTAVRHLDKWFLTMGKYRLTGKLNSFDECVEQSKDASWYRIMQIINIMIMEHDHEKPQMQQQTLEEISQDLEELYPKNKLETK